MIFLSKVKLKYSLKHGEEELKNNVMGIYLNDTLVFKDGDISFKISLKEPFYLEEKQKEYKLSMDFKEKNSTNANYHFYEIGKLNVPIYTFYIKTQENKFSLKYKLELEQVDEIFEFNVTYEVIE